MHPCEVSALTSLAITCHHTSCMFPSTALLSCRSYILRNHTSLDCLPLSLSHIDCGHIPPQSASGRHVLPCAAAGMHGNARHRRGAGGWTASCVSTAGSCAALSTAWTTPSGAPVSTHICAMTATPTTARTTWRLAKRDARLPCNECAPLTSSYRRWFYMHCLRLEGPWHRS